MKSYRTIYIIESINNAGELIYRLFAANKRTALRIAKQHSTSPDPFIRKLPKSEHAWINPADVERI